MTFQKFRCGIASFATHWARSGTRTSSRGGVAPIPGDPSLQIARRGGPGGGRVSSSNSRQWPAIQHRLAAIQAVSSIPVIPLRTWRIMRSVTVHVSEQFIAKRTHDLVPTKEAWSAYVRRRWPENCVAHVQREWDLTDGEARGVVFGAVSQRTIDKIRAHRRGGPSVVLAVEATAWGISTRELITAWIEIERGRIADERRRSDDDDRRMVEIAARLHGDAGGDVGE